MQGPNQRLKSAKTVVGSDGDKVLLPAGAFVKAIRKCYLPKDQPFGDYDESIFTAAYSQFGMVFMARDDLDWNVY